MAAKEAQPNPLVLYHARTKRVGKCWDNKDRWDHAFFRLHLGFGVHVDQTFKLDGVQYVASPKELSKKAHHALVVLIGGKDVFIYTRANLTGNMPIARVYLDAPAVSPPEQTMHCVPHLDENRVEVGSMMAWLAEQRYDLDVLKSALNGR